MNDKKKDELVKGLQKRIESAADVQMSAKHSNGVTQFSQNLYASLRGASKTEASGDQLERLYDNAEKVFVDFLKDLD